MRNAKLKSFSAPSNRPAATKVVFAFIVAALLSTLTPSIAYASETFACGENATYTITDGVVNSGNACTGDLTLSSKAIRIATFAFYGSQITSLTIPTSVTAFEYYAFYNAMSLQSLNIPASVTEIGAKPFAYSGISSVTVDPANPSFSASDGVLYDKNKTTIVSFPEKKNASGWSIPSSVNVINDYAFYNVGTLTTLQIPEGVERIGHDIASNDANLIEISIPSTLTTIVSPYTLIWNSPLATGINVASSNPNYSSVDGVLFNKDKTSLLRYPEGKATDSYEVPSTVTRIEAYAFRKSLNLKSIALGNSVTSIGSYAFTKSVSLESINIPASVEQIEESGVFLGASKLAAINVASSNANYSSVDGVLFNKNKTVIKAYPVNKPGSSYSIPSTVTTIDYYSFGAATLTAITIPTSVTSINPFAFQNSYIQKISIPNSVKTIGDYAFYYMPDLKNVTIPNSVTSLGGNTFWGTDKLIGYSYCGTTLTTTDLDNAALAGKVNTCGKNAPGAPTITSAIATGSKTATVAFTAPVTNGGLDIISYTATATPGGATGTLNQAGSGTIEITGLNAATAYTFNVVATNAVGDSNASVSSKSITTDEPPYTGTFSCGANATYTVTEGVLSNAGSCTGTLVVSSKVQVLDSYAFNGSQITSITLPNTLRSIGNGALYNLRNITTVNIPSSVTSIGDGAFSYSTFTSITVDSSSTSFSSVDGVLYNKAKTSLLRFPESKDASTWSIPTGVTTIASSALGGVTTLTKLQIPEGVTRIGAEIAGGATNLTEISIPSTVTAIERPESIIWNNRKLASINVASNNPNYSSVGGVLFNKDKTELLRYPQAKSGNNYAIPSIVTTIGAYAFQGVISVKTISGGENVTSVGDGAFWSLDSLESVDFSANVAAISPESLFYMTPKLKAINVDANNLNYTSVDGVLFNKTRTVLVTYPSNRTETSYSIPSTVTSISQWAFTSSTLKTITIPNSVTSIGGYAFYGSSIQKLTIPSSVTTIEAYAFYYMQNLKSLTIPNSVTSLGNGAFEGNDKVLGYTYCGTTLSTSMLDNAGLLGKPNVCGKSVPGAPTIGEAASTGSSTATVAFTAPASNGGATINSYTVTASPGGATGTVVQGTSGTVDISNLKSGTTYTFTIVATNPVGDSVASAPSKPITTDESRYTISCGANATYTIINHVAGNGGACSGDLVLNSKATTVGPNAFNGSKITSITMPNVKEISYGAFYNTRLLKSVNIPSSVSLIASPSDYEDFKGPFDLSAMSSINVDSANTAFSSVDGVLFNKDQSKLLRFPEGMDASKWSIPSSVKEIGDGAFMNVGTLTKLQIPEGVVKLGYGIAELASNLTEISIPSTVTDFYGPGTINLKNPLLTNIKVASNNSLFTSVDGVLFNKDKTVLIRVPEGMDASKWIWPSGITEIGDGAFAFNGTLTKLDIPEGVLKIGYTVTESAAKLTEISIPSTAKLVYPFSINYKNPLLVNIAVAANNPYYASIDGVLFNKEKTILLRFPEGIDATKWSFPTGVTETGDYAFAFVKSLTKLQIPEGVIKIGTAVAMYASNLAEIVIPASAITIDNPWSQGWLNPHLTSFNVAASNPSYTSVDGVLFNKDKTSLLRYPEGKSAGEWSIPSGVTEISDSAFYLSILEKITIPESVTSIVYGAFQSMHQLKRVRFPENLTSLPGSLFWDSNNVISYSYCGTALTTSDFENANLAGVPNVCGMDVPGSPTIAATTATGTTTASVAFTAPASNGGSAIMSYSVTVASKDSTITINQESFGTVEVTGLKPATTYSISVIATNLVGDSIASVATVKTNKLEAQVADFAAINTVFAGAAIAITPPTSSSDGTWSFVSSDPAVVTMEGGSLVIKKAGNVTITATQATTDTYLESTKTFTVTVAAIASTLGDFKPVTVSFSASPIAITPPTSNSDGAWSYVSSDPSVVTVDGSNFVTKKAGTVTITATQAASINYLTSQVTTTITANPVVTVKVTKRVINISVKGAVAKILINGKAAKLGNNTVTAGKKIITVIVAGKEIYKKTFTVK